MISRPLTRNVNSTEMALAPGAVILAEGQSLVRSGGATSLGVLPSTGASTDIFMGFAFAGTSAYPFPEQYTNKFETFVVTSTGTVVLSETPISGQVFVFDVTSNSAVSSPTVTGSTVSGLTAGDTVNVTYKYSMTAVQQVALYGNVQPGGYSGAYVGQIGVITRGLVLTSEFDASKNWAAVTNTGANQIVCGASGQLTVGTPGTNGIAFPGTVVRIPDQSYPFLGVEFSANA